MSMNMFTKIGSLNIVKPGTESTLRLHIGFTDVHESDTTKMVFDHLVKFAKADGSRAKSFDVFPGLQMSYDSDKNIIEFTEKPNVANVSIRELPSLLLRDWDVIGKEDSTALALFIDLNPLVPKETISSGNSKKITF